MLLLFTFLHSAFVMSFSDHLLSSHSDTADIMKRKSTGERLSPCLTPLVYCCTDIFFPSTFIETCRSEYSLFITLQKVGGAP